jgi:2'-5' RNA ligase
VQTLGLLLPEPFATRVIEARARLAEDPILGRIHDPPFAHFTVQMADDYDSDGLAHALAEFARQREPVPIRTVGLLTVTGPSMGITLEPYRDDRLARFHADLWDIVTPFAHGTVAPFYLPDRWVPHVTIKRCGPNGAAFGRAIAVLSGDTFLWHMTVDTLVVQHDPENNNLTRYQRLAARLGASEPGVRPPVELNATILEVVEPASDACDPRWKARIRSDDARKVELHWSAADTVRVMSAARAPLCYFRGARCRLDADVVVAVQPVTPAPIAV